MKDKKIYEFEADEILLAAGRRSNSDLLHPEKTGVETDEHGWIKVNEYLETSKKGHLGSGRRHRQAYVPAYCQLRVEDSVS